jgi:hypothetical protein
MEGGVEPAVLVPAKGVMESHAGAWPIILAVAVQNHALGFGGYADRYWQIDALSRRRALYHQSFGEGTGCQVGWVD